MSYFLGSKRYETTVWGSRDLASIASAGQSRINLPQLLTIAAFWLFVNLQVLRF
jgi:hypothetical protein